MLAKQMKCVGERVGGCLVSGGEDGDGLIAELLVAHTAAIAFDIAGRQQHRQEIAIAAAVAPALLDDLVDGLEQKSLSAAETPVGWERQTIQDRRPGHECATEHSDADAHGLADFMDLFLNISAEKSAAGDGQSQLHHLLMNVDDLAFAPTL